MSLKQIKGHVQVIVGGVILLAVTMLVFINWKNPANIWFGKNIDNQSVGMVMLISGGVGMVVVGVLRMLWRGIRAIQQGRKLARQKQAEAALREKEKQKTAPLTKPATKPAPKSTPDDSEK